MSDVCWICPQCDTVNMYGRKYCGLCGKRKDVKKNG